MKTVEQIVGENISRLLKARGISQADLARSAPIDKDHLSKIVNGKKRLGVEKEGPIAAALGCEPIDFYQNSEAPDFSTRLELIRIIISLNRDDLGIVFRFITRRLSRSRKHENNSGAAD